ncbi:MAG: PD-(D/E)XK nuclease family protein, partial [Psychrobacter sp.]|nr:PD-(D/E)XK nuclease family protein [Psychrobacter sp.]
INYPDLDKLMPSKFFYGWAKTSFTALARQLDEQSQDVAVMDERIDDDLYIASSLNWERSIDSYNIEPHSMVATPTDVRTSQLEESYLAVLKPIDDIRFSFVKGANAGTFLHEIFEKIDFINPAPWSAIIDKGVRDYQLPMSYASANQQQRRDNSDQSSNDILANDAPHQALINWIEEVIETPLLASNQPLKAIPVNRRFAELSFNMGLSEGFKAENINKIFRQYLPDEPDKHVVLTPHNIPHLYRYLRGEIDLVYEHAGKFYVVDYKSNYLGNSLSDYNQKTLIDAMSKAGYWLQAAIYQVALHRFLSMRIADYVGNESQYLGAVEYVFLRGTLALPTQRVTNEDDISDNLKTSDELTFKQRFGLVKWNIPLDFIKALDAEFGKPSR